MPPRQHFDHGPQDYRRGVVLTDVMLPGSMHDNELAQIARLLRPGLKVLYVSGYARVADRRDFCRVP